jgi:hypothetical protein
MDIDLGIEQQTNHERLHNSYEMTAIRVDEIWIVPTPRTIRVL